MSRGRRDAMLGKEIDSNAITLKKKSLLIAARVKVSFSGSMFIDLN